MNDHKKQTFTQFTTNQMSCKEDMPYQSKRKRRKIYDDELPTSSVASPTGSNTDGNTLVVDGSEETVASDLMRMKSADVVDADMSSAPSAEGSWQEGSPVSTTTDDLYEEDTVPTSTVEETNIPDDLVVGEILFESTTEGDDDEDLPSVVPVLDNTLLQLRGKPFIGDLDAFMKNYSIEHKENMFYTKNRQCLLRGSTKNVQQLSRMDEICNRVVSKFRILQFAGFGEGKEYEKLCLQQDIMDDLHSHKISGTITVTQKKKTKEQMFISGVLTQILNRYWQNS